MPLGDIINITISLSAPGITRQGFGIPLILGYNAPFPERVRYYSSASEMIEDGFDETDPEYLVAVVMCSANPRPPLFAVGRGVNKPTQKYEIRILAVEEGHEYTAYVGDVACTYTAENGDLNDDIATGLAAAIDLVTDALTTGDFTATTAGSALSKYVTVTGDAAGSWIGMSADDPNYLSITQTHDDPTPDGVADDLDAVLLADSDWYGIYFPFQSEPMVKAIAAWAEGNASKIYGYDTLDTPCINDAVDSATDVMADLQDSEYTRTFGLYHPDSSQFAGASWLALYLSFPVGKATAFGKTLAGVPVVTMTANQRKNVLDKGGNVYVKEAGRGVTLNGTMAGGQFIDLTRDVTDALKARMQENCFRLLVDDPRLPFTNKGIARMGGAVQRTLEDFAAAGVLDESSILVEVPALEDTDENDRANRLLKGIQWSARGAGAIQGVDMTGTVGA